MFSYYDNFEDKDFRGDYTLLIAGWLRACDFVGFVDSRLPPSPTALSYGQALGALIISLADDNFAQIDTYNLNQQPLPAYLDLNPKVSRTYFREQHLAAALNAVTNYGVERFIAEFVPYATNRLKQVWSARSAELPALKLPPLSAEAVIVDSAQLYLNANKSRARLAMVDCQQENGATITPKTTPEVALYESASNQELNQALSQSMEQFSAGLFGKNSFLAQSFPKILRTEPILQKIDKKEEHEIPTFSALTLLDPTSGLPLTTTHYADHSVKYLKSLNGKEAVAVESSKLPLAEHLGSLLTPLNSVKYVLGGHELCHRDVFKTVIAAGKHILAQAPSAKLDLDALTDATEVKLDHATSYFGQGKLCGRKVSILLLPNPKLARKADPIKRKAAQEKESLEKKLSKVCPSEEAVTKLVAGLKTNLCTIELLKIKKSKTGFCAQATVTIDAGKLNAQLKAATCTAYICTDTSKQVNAAQLYRLIGLLEHTNANKLSVSTFFSPGYVDTCDIGCVTSEQAKGLWALLLVAMMGQLILEPLCHELLDSGKIDRIEYDKIRLGIKKPRMQLTPTMQRLYALQEKRHFLSNCRLYVKEQSLAIRTEETTRTLYLALGQPWQDIFSLKYERALIKWFDFKKTKPSKVRAQLR